MQKTNDDQTGTNSQENSRVALTFHRIQGPRHLRIQGPHTNPNSHVEISGGQRGGPAGANTMGQGGHSRKIIDSQTGLFGQLSLLTQVYFSEYRRIEKTWGPKSGGEHKMFLRLFLWPPHFQKCVLPLPEITLC